MNLITRDVYLNRWATIVANLVSDEEEYHKLVKPGAPESMKMDLVNTAAALSYTWAAIAGYNINEEFMDTDRIDMVFSTLALVAVDELSQDVLCFDLDPATTKIMLDKVPKGVLTYFAVKWLNMDEEEE